MILINEYLNLDLRTYVINILLRGARAKKAYATQQA